MKKFKPNSSITKATISVYIPNDLADRINKASQDSNVSRSGLINQMIRHCLDNMEDISDENDTPIELVSNFEDIIERVFSELNKENKS